MPPLTSLIPVIGSAGGQKKDWQPCHLGDSNVGESKKVEDEDEGGEEWSDAGAEYERDGWLEKNETGAD